MSRSCGHAMGVIVALVGLSGCDLIARASTCPPGHGLFLQRQGTETARACVNHAEDCPFIAGILQKEEPRVRWFCK